MGSNTEPGGGRPLCLLKRDVKHKARGPESAWQTLKPGPLDGFGKGERVYKCWTFNCTFSLPRCNIVTICPAAFLRIAKGDLLRSYATRQQFNDVK